MGECFEDLMKDVVNRGLCTGCGTCAGVCPHHCLAIQWKRGEPEPALAGECPGCGICYQACPGLDIPLRDLEKFVFGKRRVQSPEDLGVYRYLGQGHATDRTVRRGGSSGGLVSALLKHALEGGLLEAALVTGFDEVRPYQPKGYLVRSGEHVADFAQSKYAMVSANELLGEAFQSGIRRLAVVGCPCHIHGIRKLQMKKLRPDIAQTVVLVLGLFCGSQAYLEGTRHVLVEECGLSGFEEVSSLQYRGGDWPGYLIVETTDGRRIEVERHHYMYHVLLPGYRRDRCMVCLDWSAELSDLSVGDHFAAPEEGEVPLGESAFIVRSEAGEKLMREAERQGVIKTLPIEKEFILGSPGFELKKHSAGYRWTQRRMYGWPIPNFQYEPIYDPIRKKTHFAPQLKK
jgi:coenzyme F420 hydrogenase subunit beta